MNDPRKINGLRTEETPDARLVIGPVSDELFEWARQATYTLSDLKLYKSTMTSCLPIAFPPLLKILNFNPKRGF